MNLSMVTQGGARAGVALGLVLAGLTWGPAAANAAPPARAYEIVSPFAKGGADVGVQPFGSAAGLYSGAAADGDRMMFAAPSNPVGDATRGVQFYATATRTADGWKTVSAIPGPQPGVTTDLASGFPNAGAYLSDDATALQFNAGAPYVNDPLLPPHYDGTSQALYLARSTDATIGWLTRPVDASATPTPGQYSLGGDAGPTSMFPAGGSKDFAISYFAFCGTLTAEDAPRIGRPNYGFYVARDGVAQTAGVLPDGSVDPDGAEPAGDVEPGCSSAFFTAPPVDAAHQVSADGSRAFFVSPAPFDSHQHAIGRPSQLYVHREGRPSLLISRSPADDGTPTPAGVSGLGPITYAFATPDGAHVVFASTDRLTADAPGGSSTPLRYRADIDGDAVHLTYLPDVTGTILGISDDGQRILSADGGVLALDDHGTTTILDSSAGGSPGDFTSPRGSTDGSTWVFTSTRALGDSPTQVPGTAEVYRYVIGDAAPTCLSCVAVGAPPARGAFLDPWTPPGPGRDWGGGGPRRGARVVSPDGRRVSFETADALLPQDTNDVDDVYGWEDGKLSLISAGTGLRNSYLLDTSASGDDVFFATADDLVAGDQDGSYDVYDARVGGGFAEPHAPADACSGDACQGPPSLRPIVAVPGTTTVGASGNVAPPQAPVPPASAKAALVSRKGTGGHAVLKVRVPGAGRIVASGAGLRTTRRTVTHGATYTLTVKLTAAAARTLRRHGKRSSRIRVTFTPTGTTGGRATTITVALTVRK